MANEKSSADAQSIWSRQMLRNPRIGWAVALSLLACLPAGVMEPITDYPQVLAHFLRAALLICVVVALERRIHRLRLPRERTFWHEVSLAFICALAAQLAEAIFATAATPSNAAAVLLGSLNIGTAVILVYAVEAAPHREDRPSLVARQEGLNRAAVLVTLITLAAYFDLAPRLAPARSEPWSEVVLHGLLYLYLFARLTYHGQTCPSPRWRHLYRHMSWAVVPAVLLWILAAATRLSAGDARDPATEYLDILTHLTLSPLWVLAYWLWIVTAEARFLALPAPPPRRAPLRPITHGTSSSFYILVCALVLPCLHLALYKVGRLADHTVESRQLIVTISLLILGGIALRQHWTIRQSSNELLIRRARAESALRKSQASVRLNMQRQSSAQELKVADERFAKFFRSSPIALLISTAEGGSIVEANEHFAVLSGYSSEDWTGKTVQNLGLWRSRDVHRSLVHAVQHGKLRHRQLELMRKDGEIRTVLLSAEPFDIAGQACILAVMRDISAQERSRSLLNQRSDWRRHIENQRRLKRWPRPDDAPSTAPSAD